MSQEVSSPTRIDDPVFVPSDAPVTILHDVGTQRAAIVIRDGDRLEFSWIRTSSDGTEHESERHVLERDGTTLRWQLHATIEDAVFCDGPFSYQDVRVCGLDDALERSVAMLPPRMPIWLDPALDDD